LPPATLQIGLVLRSHGLRGLVRARATTDAIAALPQVLIGGRSYKIERVTAERGDYLLQLEGVTGRDQADALRGSLIEAVRSDLPPPAEGEVYADDLIGCRVQDLAGRTLGEVSGSFPSGAHEVLEIKGTPDFLLPLVPAMVTSVDVAARLIVCDPPPGLIDLDQADQAGGPGDT
jgi:16S rRNA processing protein RimM